MSLSHAEICGGNPDLPPAIINEPQHLLAKLTEISSLTAMVAATLIGVRTIGLLLLCHIIEERDVKYCRSTCAVGCDNCGTPMKRGKNLRKVGRYTLLGRLCYRRCDYHCPTCNSRRFPLDGELEIAENLRGHSLEFTSELTLLCVVVPFGWDEDLALAANADEPGACQIKAAA